MRTKLMFVVIVVLVAMMAMPCFASTILEPQTTGQSTGGPSYSGMDDIAEFCQMPDLVNWAKLASQIDTSYPFDAGTADDYLSDSDYALTRIQWWGGSWNFTNYCPPDYFVITFYEHDGTCMPPVPAPSPPDYKPNNYLYQEVIYTWNETVIDDVDFLFEYSADIGPVLQDAGKRYWVEIQAGMNFGSCGQWGWLNSLDQFNCPIARGFPLLGSEYWYGDLDYPATAFCLYSDHAIPTEESSWGHVKSLYR